MMEMDEMHEKLINRVNDMRNELLFEISCNSQCLGNVVLPFGRLLCAMVRIVVAAEVGDVNESEEARSRHFYIWTICMPEMIIA